MREYQTTGTIRVNGGYIGLDQRQAGARRNRVRRVADGVYEVLTPIELKAGETIRLADPDKVTLMHLDCLDKPVPEPKPAPAQAIEPAPAPPAKKPAARKSTTKKAGK